MPNKRLLFISTGILLVTTFIVGMFGVVPLPEYDLITEDSNFEGKVIYLLKSKQKILSHQLQTFWIVAFYM